MSNIQKNFFDRRISKTKHALKMAILALMKTKDFNSISITDIVQMADINRGTFYKHYKLKEELLDDIIDDVLTDLICSYRAPYENLNMFEIKKLTPSNIKIFEHVNKNQEFYTLIMQSNQLPGFQHKICSVIKKLALEDLCVARPSPTLNRDLHASYQSYAIFGMIVEWVNGGYVYSCEYMAEQLYEILQSRETDTIYTLNTTD